MEFGQLFAGHGLARLAGQGLRAVRIERGGFLEELQGLGPLIAGLILQAELDEGLGVLRVLRSRRLERGDGIGAGEDPLDLLQELFGRRLVAGDPVDLLPVTVQEEEERSAADAEPLDQALAGEIAAAGPIEYDVLFEELGELGDIVELLDQQLAVASAVLLEEVEEQELTARFGLGQRVFE
jgi:hypothetical protein